LGGINLQFPFTEKLGDRLVEQGFDARETDAVLDSLVEKYRNGWDFRRKVHLGKYRESTIVDAGEC